MLTALSEELKLRLEVKHFECALAYLELLEQDLFRIFGGVGRNELAAVAIKINEYVEARDIPVSKRDLKTNFFTMCRPPNEFDDCLRYLVDSGKLKEATMHAGTYMDTIYATPTVMQAFADEAHVKGVSQTLMPPASVASVDPSSARGEGHFPTIQVSQVVAQHFDETAIDASRPVEIEVD